MGVLEVKNVSYEYTRDRVVLDDISESFERGKMYVILGPSGCGKTTLLSILGGLDFPRKGQVLFEGREIQKKELEEHRRSHVSFVLKLSGGQQQRVAIARALASGNPVILADEPTGNLDEDMAKEITGIFKEAAEKYDKCVILVSHSNEVAKQADVVFEMSHGKLTRTEM